VLEHPERLAVRGGELLAACGKRGFAVGGKSVLHRLDQIGQRRFCIGRNDEIDFGEALEILVVRLDVEVRRADADELGAGLMVVSE
jgi:hypothetical protein